MFDLKRNTSTDSQVEDVSSASLSQPHDLESQDDGDVEAGGQSGYSGKRFALSPRMISDAILGSSDGLTVPFALTAGLSSLGDTRLVVLGGFAELIAGAISMGLGGFIGAKSEA